MIITAIEVSNFFSYVSESLTFSEKDPVFVFGDNGSGKSSFFREAVNWALFGKCRGSVKTDDVVRFGEKEGSVIIRFRVGDFNYVV